MTTREQYKDSIERQMIVKLNSCHNIGIICSYRTVLDIELEAAQERENWRRADIIQDLIIEDINS